MSQRSSNTMIHNNVFVCQESNAQYNHNILQNTDCFLQILSFR